MTWSKADECESSLRDAILRAGPALRERLATRHVELGARATDGLSKKQDGERLGTNGWGPERQRELSPPAQDSKRMVLQPCSFYSRRRLESVEEHILQFLARVHTRASGGAPPGRPVWVLHPTQRAAFDHADQLNDGLQDGDPQYCRYAFGCQQNQTCFVHHGQTIHIPGITTLMMIAEYGPWRPATMADDASWPLL